MRERTILRTSILPGLGASATAARSRASSAGSGSRAASGGDSATTGGRDAAPGAGGSYPIPANSHKTITVAGAGVAKSSRPCPSQDVTVSPTAVRTWHLSVSRPSVHASAAVARHLPGAAERHVGVGVDRVAQLARGRRRGPRPSPAPSAARGTTRWDDRGTASGVRYGASVSTSSRSSGVTASALRSGAAFLKVTVPAKLEVRPAVQAPAGERVVAGEAVHDPPLGRALLVDDAQHVVVGVAVVDDQGLVQPLGEVDVAPERLLLHGPPLLGRCGSGPGPSPPRPAPVVRSGQPLDLRHRRRRGPSTRGASLGCSATPATTRGCRAAASTAQRAPGRSQPICTMRGDVRRPARRWMAAPRLDPTSPSAMSRWQWLSTTG